MTASAHRGISRRALLVGGGAGVGLLVAWAIWPREYAHDLAVREGETAFGAFLKIGSDGRVIVAVPAIEHGQGVYTALPQIVADELGADWRTIGVEPAPPGPFYANPLAAEELFGTVASRVPAIAATEGARRAMLAMTGGSSAVRHFEQPLREAAAGARALLCMAAARRWGGDWRECTTADGFVQRGGERLRFAELAADASRETAPDAVPLRSDEGERLAGSAVTRLDTPAKVDGSANFAGDIRLPGMVFAAIRQGPLGDTRLLRVDTAAVDAMPGVLRVVTNDRWVAAIGSDWWAANRALDLLAPRFETRAPVSSDGVEAMLADALDGGGDRIAAIGDVGAAFRGARVFTATYHADIGLHAAIEPTTGTAVFEDGRLRLWAATLAPQSARAAAARALGLGEDRVTVIPVQAGGSFGAGLDPLVAEQAALLARDLGRPVQLTWSRVEDMMRPCPRPAASARMAARLDANGRLTSWLTKIAAPSVGRELARRVLGNEATTALSLALPGGGDAAAVAGAVPPYAIPNVAVDHHPADPGMRSGHLRGGMHGATCFFNESFLDELARLAEMDASYLRIQMLGQNARLAACINTVASLGGWQGGAIGSAQGIACHQFRGSSIAVLAEARLEGGRVRCDRLVAAVDCGRAINPDLVLQQVEGGLIFGLAQAIGCSTRLKAGVAEARRLADLRLPTLADAPEITVELIRSQADPGGVGELAVPPVAPAVANAIFAASGQRLRRLPLDPARP